MSRHHAREDDQRPLTSVRFSEDSAKPETGGLQRVRTQGSAATASAREQSGLTNPSVITGHIRMAGSAWLSRRVSATTESPEEAMHPVLGSRYFRWFINGTIVLSAIEMGFAAGHQNAEYDTLFLVFEHFFTAVFALEMFLKLWALRVKYFSCPVKGPWNTLDFCIAWISILDMWVLSWAISGGASLEIIRVFRLARVARIAKLARSFPEVVIVVQGLIASLRAMVWILVLLVMVIYTFSLIFVENVGNTDAYPAFNMNMDVEISDLVDDFNNYFYFGTVFRAMVTLWGVILLAEWDVARPIYELQPIMFAVLAMVVCVATLGIFNIIIGVIVERTTQAIFDAREMSQEEVRNRRAVLAHKLADVMFDIDANSDGVISRHELMQARDNKDLIEILESIQLPQGFTLLNLHMMLDLRGHGVITKSEFIMGMLRLIDSDAFSRVCLTQFAIGQLKISVNALRDDVRQDVREIISGERAEVAALKDSTASILKELCLLRADLAEDARSDRTSCRSHVMSGERVEVTPTPRGSLERPAGNTEALRGQSSAVSGALADAVQRLEAPLARLVELARSGQPHAAQAEQISIASDQLAEWEHCQHSAIQHTAIRSLQEELEQVALSEVSPALSKVAAGLLLPNSRIHPQLEQSLHGIPPEQKIQEINVGAGQSRAKKPESWPKDVAALIRSVAISPAPSISTIGFASAALPPDPFQWRQ